MAVIGIHNLRREEFRGQRCGTEANWWALPTLEGERRYIGERSHA